MAKATHRATGLTNVSETWDQNEQKRADAQSGDNSGSAPEEVPAASELDRVIREEATEYDNDNKENRLLGGDRATRNDD